MPTINDFSKGDKVRFGRGQGEQTLGTVVKVNRAKLKVRQDESRGTMKSHPVGTIWTVPPSLCVKVESGTERVAPRTPAPVATRQDNSFHVGQQVEFDNAGRTITGTVKRVNSKTISVNPEGETSGRYWRVSPRLLRVSGSAPASQQAPSRLPLAVGQPVEFQGFSWAARGVSTVTGVVTKVNHAQGTYEVVYGHRVSIEKASDVTKVARRPDADIVSECLSVYGALSPENLHMDGEASRTYVRRRYAELQRALKALWKEAGRTISEDECYRAWEAKRASK